MSEGHFKAKYNFRCGYCKKNFKAGSDCFYILKHGKKACVECREHLASKFYGRES